MSLIEKSAVAAPVIHTDTKVTLRTAGTGGELVTSTKAQQDFNLNGVEYVHDFLVVDSLGLEGVSVILGIDVIQSLPFNMFSEGGKFRVYLDGYEIATAIQATPPSVCVIGMAEADPISMVTREDTCIPAQSTLDVGLGVVKYRFMPS